LEWKEKFDKELEEKEKATKSLAAIKKEEAKKLKLTGKFDYLAKKYIYI
jgi:hypothetical protein